MVQDSGTLSHIDQIWGVIFKQGYQIKYKMSSQLRISDWQQILFSIASAMQYLGHTSIKNLSVFFFWNSMCSFQITWVSFIFICQIWKIYIKNSSSLWKPQSPLVSFCTPLPCHHHTTISQPHWPHFCSFNRLGLSLPQCLCMCYSLCMEHSGSLRDWLLFFLHPSSNATISERLPLIRWSKGTPSCPVSVVLLYHCVYI